MPYSTSKENIFASEVDNLVAQGAIREVLTAARTYYVTVAGSDSNDGLTPGTAFLTINKAIRVVAETLDLSFNAVTIDVGAGTFNEQVTLRRVVGNGSVILQGQGDTTIINGGAAWAICHFQPSNSWIVKDLKVETTTDLSGAILVSDTIGLYLQDITIGNCNARGIFLAAQAHVRLLGTIKIDGTIGNDAISLLANSTINADNATIECAVGSNASVFLRCASNSGISFLNGSFTTPGNFTGSKFIVSDGSSVISATGTSDLNELPGTIAGTLGDSCSYDEVVGAALTGDYREKLTANRTYYVDPAGSDTNDGLTVGTPFLTLERARDAFYEIDAEQYQVDIQLADGTYTLSGSLGFSEVVGNGGFVKIIGNTGDSSLVVIEVPTFTTGLTFANSSTEYFLEGVTLKAVTAATPLFLVSCSNSQISIKDCRFDITGVFVAAIATAQNSALILDDDIDVLGTSGASLLQITDHSSLTAAAGATVDFTVAMSFTSEVLQVLNYGFADLTGVTFANGGNVTGKRFTLGQKSHIRTGTEDLTYVPGTVAGTLDAASSYDNLLGAVINGEIRERLTANRTYYVRTDGSDSNTGLTNDAADAFLTVQRAVDQVCEIDNNGFDVNLNVQAGTFAGGIELGPIIGAGQVTIEGQGATTILTHNVTRVILCDRATSGDWEIRNLNLETTTAFNLQSLASFTGKLLLGPGLTFAGTPSGNNPHISWEGGVLEAVNVTVSIESAPGGGAWLRVLDNGKVRFTNCTISFDSGGCILTPGFCTVSGSGSAIFGGAGTTFVNSYTGDEYQVRSEGFLSVNATSLPIPASSPGQLFGTNSKFNATDLYTGRNVETLTANKTLTDNESFRIQILTPSGANRDVNLPTGTVDGVQEYLVINPAGSGFDLLLKESAVTLSTITPGTQAAVVYDGADWITI